VAVGIATMNSVAVLVLHFLPSMGMESISQVLSQISTLAAGMLMFVSPLTILVNAFRRRNGSAIFILPTLAMCVSGGIWAVYAVHLDDWVVGVPNGTGCVVSLVQLLLKLMLHLVAN
jgi:hypothetical protein